MSSGNAKKFPVEFELFVKVEFGRLHMVLFHLDAIAPAPMTLKGISLLRVLGPRGLGQSEAGGPQACHWSDGGRQFRRISEGRYVGCQAPRGRAENRGINWTQA